MVSHQKSLTRTSHTQVFCHLSSLNCGRSTLNCAVLKDAAAYREKMGADRCKVLQCFNASEVSFTCDARTQKQHVLYQPKS